MAVAVKFAVFVLILLFAYVSHVKNSALKYKPRSFSISYESNAFLKDGLPFRYISGSIHYSRIHHFYWEDRLLKMFAAGLDAIQVYVPWNVHEPRSGVYDFEGQQDLVHFLQTAHKIGLLVILRAGPYICGEWEFGGFPPWLLKNRMKITLRSMDPAYIGPVDRWLSVLLPKIEPLLYNNGGPIITVQVENEYGSYFACDHNYQAFLRDRFIKYLGNTTVLFTTDGAGVGYLKCGKIPNVYATVDFGPGNASSAFISQRVYEPKGPLVNSEYYTGWLDYWGRPHAHYATDMVVKTLDQILSLGASVNMYMFEGGTNFGYMNGADPPFNVVPTSYDYDAPLSEAGDITDKYIAIRTLLSKYKRIPSIPVPPSTKKYAYGKVALKFVTSLNQKSCIFRQMTSGSMVQSRFPLSMEDIDQNYGFIMYQTMIQKSVFGGKLSIPGLRDRAYVSVYDTPVAILDRTGETMVILDLNQGDYLQILVENMGRINYGSQINDNRKGIISNVTLNDVILESWYISQVHIEDVNDSPGCADMNRIQKNFPRTGQYKNSVIIGPSVFTGQLILPKSLLQPADTYIKMDGWFKGQVFINGVNLGRYWPVRGPQITLYVPAPVLKPHPLVNNVTIAELEWAPCTRQTTTSQTDPCYVEFVAAPILNATTLSTTQHHRTYQMFRIPH